MNGLGDLPRDVSALGARPSSGAWLQLRRLLAEALASALESKKLGSIQVMLVGGGERLADAIAEDGDLQLKYADNAAGISCRHSEHAVVVVVPRVPTADRVELLRAAFESVRPSGTLIVVATVVITDGEDRGFVPSMRQLIEELNDAAGLALHVEEIRSVRWYGEQVTRGVILAGASLGIEDAI